MISIANELKTAQDFLDYLDDIYGRTQIKPKTVNDALDAWQEWERQGITQPQNAVQVASDPFSVYRSYFEDILIACELSEIDTSVVFFSLIRINNLNAYANNMPNNDKVIVFDENLVSFLTAFIIAAMVGVYSNPSDDDIRHLEQFVIQNLKNFHGESKTPVDNTAFANDFRKIIKTDYKLTEIGCYFSMAFTVFIICHELSHHLLGHSEKKRMHMAPSNNSENPIPLNTPEHEEEFEADELGYKLFIELIDKVDQVQSAKLSQAFNHAPLIFFEIIDIVDLFTTKEDIHPQINDTHPLPMKRKERLIKRYQSKLHTDGSELYKGFMGFSKHIKELLRTA